MICSVMPPLSQTARRRFRRRPDRPATHRRFDRRVGGRGQGVLHLHGFEHGERLAALHLVAGLHQHLDDLARHRRDDAIRRLAAMLRRFERIEWLEREGLACAHHRDRRRSRAAADGCRSLPDHRAARQSACRRPRNSTTCRAAPAKTEAVARIPRIGALGICLIGRQTAPRPRECRSPARYAARVRRCGGR